MIRAAGAADHGWIRATAAEVYRALGDYGVIIASWLEHAGVHAFVEQPPGAAERRGFTLVGLHLPDDAGAGRIGPPCVADLLAIAVAPAHQRRGLGRALLRHAIALARAELRPGVAPELRLTVAEDNLAARRLFARHGFELLDRDHGSYDGGQRALRMRLRL